MPISDADKYAAALNHICLARKHLARAERHIDEIRRLAPGRLRAGADAALKHLDKLDNALAAKYKRTEHETGNAHAV